MNHREKKEKIDDNNKNNLINFSFRLAHIFSLFITSHLPIRIIMFSIQVWSFRLFFFMVAILIRS